MKVNVTYEFDDDDLALLKRHFGKVPPREDLRWIIKVAVDQTLNEWYEQEGSDE